MPHGPYPGRGLIPGFSISDDEEGPCVLPKGLIVYCAHGLVVCSKCCNEDSDSDDDDETAESSPNWIRGAIWSSWSTRGTEMVRGTGKVFPSKFVPSNGSTPPLEEFPNRNLPMSLFRRTHSRDDSKVLIMAAGACLDNGRPKPSAGWAFFHGECLRGLPLLVSGRLENKGPWGDQASQTNNRAELRAVLAALRFRNWRGEGVKTIVFATDSSYVVDGATQWVRAWVNNGWRTSDGKEAGPADIKNKDLWAMLLGECEKAHYCGQAIEFWKIPREWNTLADETAKKAAAELDVSYRWKDIEDISMLGTGGQLNQ